MAARLDRQYNQAEIDEALSILIAFAGNAEAAARDLKERNTKAPCSETLKKWAATLHWERYEELRELHNGKMEGKLTNEMLDATRRATEGAMLATDKAVQKLEANKDDDPSKTAANLAAVAQRMTDKRLALQGRPTQIHETRDAAEILRRLVAMGVLQAPEDPVQIEAAE